MRATWSTLDPASNDVLEDALNIAWLLELLGHPLDADAERGRVHTWLRASHVSEARAFGEVGGFDDDGLDEEHRSSSYAGTWYAVQLMRIFGIPDGIDVNGIRSFLRNKGFMAGQRRWVAFVTREALDDLPGVESLTWRDYLRYERTLIAVILLVLLCIVATLRAPPVPMPPASS